MSFRRHWKRIAILAALTAAVVLLFVKYGGSSVLHEALTLVERARGSGAAGMFVWSVSYLVGSLVFFPALVLTLSGGYLYGPYVGFVLTYPVCVGTAAVMFLIARWVARETVAARLGRQRLYLSLEDAVAEDGFRIIVLLRQSPLFPYGLLNYALGLTRIRFSTFVLASAVGLAPPVAMVVWLGSLMTNATELLAGEPAGPLQQVSFWGGLAATVLASILASRAARRALHRRFGTPNALSEPGR